MKKSTTLPNIHRIRRASRLFIRILQFLMILVPLADLTIWVFANNLIEPVLATTLPAYVQLPLPLSARLLAFCVSLVPLSLFIFANATLIRLFRLYENGLIFNADNVRCFRYLSRALMAWCLVGVLIDPMMSIARKASACFPSDWVRLI